MKIICRTPPGRNAEREYVFGVLLGEWLGLDWECLEACDTYVSLRMAGDPQELRLPDSFFGRADQDWLGQRSLPQLPLATWDTAELEADLPLILPSVPVIFGDAHPAVFRNENVLGLPIDVFGSAFFMLTMYEEIVLPDRDSYDRFPSWASIAGREGFLDRPIIDEYLEIFWAAMTQLWPSLIRRPRKFSMILSHDVDRPARYAFAPPGKLLRRMAGDVLRRGQVSSFLIALRHRFGVRSTLPPNDPANTFDWIMDLSERRGFRSAFYFMCGRTNPAMDADYEPEHPAIRDLLRRVHSRGHEIGLHPSFDTYLDPGSLAVEANRLRRVCAEEGISQEQWGGRMHYLRWRHPETLNAWGLAELDYDSTLGYADCAGFRCGTCHEYASFDAQNGIAIRTRTRPLVAMESSVMAEPYMNLGTGDEALRCFERLKNACRVVQGNFTLLWHNSEFDSVEKRDLYQELLG